MSTPHSVYGVFRAIPYLVAEETLLGVFSSARMARKAAAEVDPRDGEEVVVKEFILNELDEGELLEEAV